MFRRLERKLGLLADAESRIISGRLFGEDAAGHPDPYHITAADLPRSLRGTHRFREKLENGPSRRETLWMAIVTGIYLLFEVAFGARLLDVVSTTTDPDVIHPIEVAGRIISGIALTLVVWGVILLPAMRRRAWLDIWQRAALFIGSAIACCAFSYFVQEAILQGISHASSPEQKQAASTLSLVASGVQNAEAVLEGIDMDQVGRDSPELKTFLALLPAMALSVDDLSARTSSELDKILRSRTDAMIGGFKAFYEDRYVPSLPVIESMHDTYMAASEERARGMRKADEQVRTSYRQYRNSLGRYTPDTLPRSYRRQVVRGIQNRGIPIPGNWDLRDRAGFYAAAEEAFGGRIERAYDDAMSRLFSRPYAGGVPRYDFTGRVKPGMSTQEFLDSPELQDHWRAITGAGPEARLIFNLESEEAWRRIYDPWLTAVVADRKGLYIAPVEDFARGGARYDEGVEAIRIAYIPLIAFGFSLLGALVHTFKTANYLIQTSTGMRHPEGLLKAQIGKKATITAVAMGAVICAVNTNPVTESELFSSLEIQVSEKGSAFLAPVMRGTVQLQSYAYPVAEQIRRALGGISFDFDPDTPTTAFGV
ncbi:hypothetical protein [Paracoccus sp. ME4]|uniref:hypothetical protein n=1 Tax=Paracoccus sp. ME4 TaxID=3138066 RepID=UPI00398ABDA2